MKKEANFSGVILGSKSHTYIECSFSFFLLLNAAWFNLKNLFAFGIIFPDKISKAFSASSFEENIKKPYPFEQPVFLSWIIFAVFIGTSKFKKKIFIRKKYTYCMNGKHLLNSWGPSIALIPRSINFYLRYLILFRGLFLFLSMNMMFGFGSFYFNIFFLELNFLYHFFRIKLKELLINVMDFVKLVVGKITK